MRRIAPTLPLLFILAAGLPCAAQTVPTFTHIPPLQPGLLCDMWGISPNGNWVVGRCEVFGGNRVAARWSRQTGTLNMFTLPGQNFALAYDASDDGSVIVGESGRAFRWTGGVMTDLGALPGGWYSQARGVSGDGTVVVGYSNPGGGNVGFRWTAATGMVGLGSFPGADPWCQALGVSRDGLTIVGWAAAGSTYPFPIQACRWRDGIPHNLGTLGGTDSQANAASDDGEVIVGWSHTSPTSPTHTPVRWVSGLIQALPVLPNSLATTAQAVSGDGTVIGGYRNMEPSGHRAVIWTGSPPQVHDLHELLASMGVNVTGWELYFVRAINEDGTVLLAHGGHPSFGSRGVVIDFRGDADGDGLLDHWEINGIPYLNDLGQSRRLHLPGANPARKDLYVEIDAMQGMSIQQDAINLVVQSFADAPLGNPDGSTGITLHVLVDESDLAPIPVWQTNGCWPQGYDSYYQARFGTAAERAANGGGGLLFRTARAKAYRYCIVAALANPNIGGCGKAPGDKTVLFLGAMPGTIQHAAVFMHELGHNLGLHHGGHDGVNGKPNYPSIMNYTLSYKAPWNESFWRLDYSREGGLLLGHLNESNLDETRGIGYPGGPYADFLMPFGISTAAGPRDYAYAPLDGTPTDFGNTTGTMIPDDEFTVGVVQDLNYLPEPPAGIYLPTEASPGQMLQAHNDWAAIVLATPEAIGAGAPVQVDPQDELTIEAVQWMAQNFPMPGGSPCYANCDSSTAAPVLNVQDFTCFLQRYAAGESYANCDNSTVQPVLNVQDFTCFLQRYAAGCP